MRMQDAKATQRIESKFRSLIGIMDERMRRQWAGAEAQAFGWGGIQALADATGLSPTTIRKGVSEVRARRLRPREPLPTRLRRPGGGRKPTSVSDPGLAIALEALVESTTRGDPQSSLRWTCKSTRTLARALTRQGHPVSAATVGRLLRAQGYSLQGNRKTKEGESHPDRDAQFQHINAMVKAFQRRGQPVISVDTKKKELVGEFKNLGREWRRAGQPLEVRVHDFLDKTMGKAIPYGVYDITGNQGWVSVGIDHDTARFAAGAIGRWWKKMGRRRYPHARQLLITADGGGSNGSRCRLWKVALQDLAERLDISIAVCHFPPGTSKWNKIEHRMFCHITQNWRGKPLVSHQVIVNLIASTATQKGLRIQAELDKRQYPSGIKVTDAELSQVNLQPDEFHGDWNYKIKPASHEKIR
jgi:hypothetical protein